MKIPGALESWSLDLWVSEPLVSWLLSHSLISLLPQESTAEVSEGRGVPRRKKKFYSDFLGGFCQILRPPSNFSAFVSKLQNNMADRLLDNHIFPECQELSSFLKAAQPFGTFKFLRSKSYNFRNGQKNRGTFLLWHLMGFNKNSLEINGHS